MLKLIKLFAATRGRILFSEQWVKLCSSWIGKIIVYSLKEQQNHNHFFFILLRAFILAILWELMYMKAILMQETPFDGEQKIAVFNQFIVFFFRAVYVHPVVHTWKKCKQKKNITSTSKFVCSCNTFQHFHLLIIFFLTLLGSLGTSDSQISWDSVCVWAITHAI